MRLTLRICTLPLLAGLIGSVVACSEGSTTPAGDGDGGEDSTGAGGATSTATSSGGTASTECFNFVDSTDNWKKNFAFVSDPADKTLRDATASDALLAGTMADWMDAPGYGGTNGFVQLTIPYQPTQIEYQGLLYSFLPATGRDLSGKTVSAFVKLVSGMTASDPSKPSGAKLVVKSGADYFYGDGGWQNLSQNEWIKITIDVSKPENVDKSKDFSLYDPTDIREISVEIDTSGSAIAVESPGIVHIDKVCY